MNRITNNGLEVLQFEHPGFSGCLHGFFTRKGGVSIGQWTSLNQGGTVGDERLHTIENRKRAFSFFDRKVESIFDVWQVHGNNVICAETPRVLDEPHTKADAILTNKPELSLFMRFADCVPILLFDPVKKVVGSVHAGWKGTVNNIVGDAVKKLQEKYDVIPSDIIAGIGPSIGPDHYVVGDEVQAMAEKTFGDDINQVISFKNRKIHFNLWRANEYLLEKQGVKAIECARICTACNLDDWYSHRAENGATGRFGALIALREPYD
ncbi:MAG: peptidoglycan editing factor PgeF [Anaerolinea sp.]|nr:peptidoglycan editing factor PgeF [Anaerolinea sp.]